LAVSVSALADENVVHREGQPDAFHVSAQDPRLREAQALARQRVDEFIAAFEHAGPQQRSFAVKVPVIDGTLIEYFWVDLEGFANGQFTGHIGNEPLEVHSVRLGDRVVVDKERISDWMYVERGHLVGGYSLRALRDGMNEADRKAFDATLPFEIAE
jgi:uncharacterized protein YegJ (DUF2314 family)